MIARSLSRCRPIPFTDPLHEPPGLSRAVRWTPPPPFPAGLVTPRPAATATSWMSRPLAGLHSANDSSKHPARSQGATAAQAALPASARLAAVRPASTPVLRQALARYDGPHSLSVRSSATGRHYRFPEQGCTQVIDAADIALMRRIEDITLL